MNWKKKEMIDEDDEDLKACGFIVPDDVLLENSDLEDEDPEFRIDLIRKKLAMMNKTIKD